MWGRQMRQRVGREVSSQEINKELTFGIKIIIFTLTFLIEIKSISYIILGA